MEDVSRTWSGIAGFWQERAGDKQHVPGPLPEVSGVQSSRFWDLQGVGVCVLGRSLYGTDCILPSWRSSDGVT